MARRRGGGEDGTAAEGAGAPASSAAGARRRAPAQGREAEAAEGAPRRAAGRSRRGAGARARAKAKAPPAPSLPAGAEARARWAAAVARAREAGEACTLALFDVDGFAEHAARLGPERAGRLLELVGARLRHELSDAAALGRLAGDLFGVALPGVDVEEALGLVERVRHALGATPFQVPGPGGRRRVDLTARAALAGLRRDAEDLPGLIEQARAGLWRARTHGGARLGLPVKERMVLKSSYYSQGQLDQLKALAQRTGQKEAELLRAALEALLLEHKDRPPGPGPGST